MAKLTSAYDTSNHFEVIIWETAYRKDTGKDWLARIYQPVEKGTFPCLLVVHGGVWNLGDRTALAGINRRLAASGLCVVSIDFRLAPQHPYPAQVADVNFATRWLKAHAQEFNADATRLGIMGASSGGHTALLSAMKPDDPLYTVLHLPEALDTDASVNWVIALWPVIDPYARYLYAQQVGRNELVTMTKAYFLTEKTMQEGNPQLMLERGEKVQLPPVQVIQGTADNNIPMSIPNRFAASYRAAGGELDLETFEGMPHNFANLPGPETERAMRLMKAWIARRLDD